MITAVFSASLDIHQVTLALTACLDRIFGSRRKSEGMLLKQGEDPDEEDDQGGFEVEHGVLEASNEDAFKDVWKLVMHTFA